MFYHSSDGLRGSRAYKAFVSERHHQPFRPPDFTFSIRAGHTGVT